MKRLFDIFMSFTLIILIIFPVLIISIAIRLTSSGPAIYWSNRIGRNNIIFRMPKFRSMYQDTPPVASHLLTDAEQFLTPIGGFLRRTSLDELPQLYSILKGDMSFVGPRPALYNQKDLISMRTEKEIDKLLPGITGWAQINGRDELSLTQKVNLDEEYLKQRSFWLDLKILWATLLLVLRRDNIYH